MRYYMCKIAEPVQNESEVSLLKTLPDIIRDGRDCHSRLVSFAMTDVFMLVLFVDYFCYSELVARSRHVLFTCRVQQGLSSSR